MKRYLFFLRAYNDVDNIAPVIYFLLKKNDENIAHVIFYTCDYDHRNNENLAFLDEQFPGRVRVEWLGARVGLDPDVFLKQPRTLWNKIIGGLKRPQLRWVTKDSSRYPRERRKAVIAEIFDDGPRPDFVGFDQNRSWQIGGLGRALRDNGVKNIVALPVSPLLNYNTYRDVDTMGLTVESLKHHHDYDVFDSVIYTERFYPESLEKTYALIGHPSPVAGKSVVLGSMRYCPEWMEVRRQFTPAYVRPGEKVKFVYFLSRPKTNASWGEVLRSLEFLAQFSGLDVVVKPHTRDFDLEVPGLAKTITFESSTPSSALIDWADVVMVWGSSVVIEAFLKGKKVLVQDYVHGNRNLCAHLDAGTVLYCRDDLHHALVTLERNGPQGLSQSEEGVSRLIDEVVYGERRGSVPDRYLEFIDTCNPFEAPRNRTADPERAVMPETR